jgi:ankyrin repeat protein
MSMSGPNEFLRQWEILIQGGQADLLIKDEYGNSLLHRAAQLNVPDIALKLMDKGLSINNCNFAGQMPLHTAVMHGNTELVDLLLLCHADITGIDKDGNSLLHLAARLNVQNIVLKLVLSGVPISLKNHAKQTAREVALTSGQVRIRELLIFLEYIQQRNRQCNKKQQALGAPETGGHQVFMDPNLLGISDKVTTTTTDMLNQTFFPEPMAIRPAFHWLRSPMKIYNSESIPTEKENAFMCKQSVSVVENPLIQSICNGYYNLAKRLIAKGTNILDSDAQGNTPLHLAIMRGTQDFYPNSTAQQHRIDRINSAIIVSDLLNQGADPSAFNKKSVNAIQLAVQVRRFFDIVQLFVKYAYNRNLLKMAAQNNTDQVYRAIKNGADINSRTVNGLSALHFTVINGNQDLFWALVKGQADTNIADVNKVTPLHLAVQFGSIAMVRGLLKSGADVNSARADGNTPLHLALMRSTDHGGVCLTKEQKLFERRRSALIVNELVHSGADIMKTNNERISPKSLAIILKRYRMVQLFENFL